MAKFSLHWKKQLAPFRVKNAINKHDIHFYRTSAPRSTLVKSFAQCHVQIVSSTRLYVTLLTWNRHVRELTQLTNVWTQCLVNGRLFGHNNYHGRHLKPDWPQYFKISSFDGWRTTILPTIAFWHLTGHITTGERHFTFDWPQNHVNYQLTRELLDKYE